MNFLTIHLGAFALLFVLIQNCGCTQTAAKSSCKDKCTGEPSYNSGYTSVSPPVLSTPLATQTNVASSYPAVAYPSPNYNGGIVPPGIIQGGYGSYYGAQQCSLNTIRACCG
ncbi:uncharacterized protein LOC129907482 [Episyrphus balteatus]|uniref:uncharacterized protein LOC129907482 n=1 Tax=Episyrphus balteatus TaxID=286459 RepID=UPI00248500DF|nr:uncharacterized protein LOC129907482 [Episyrphus balteatus]